MSALTNVTEQLARKASVAIATQGADLEQKQRVEEAKERKEWDQAERTVSERERKIVSDDILAGCLGDLRILGSGYFIKFAYPGAACPGVPIR